MPQSKSYGWVQLPITVVICIVLDYLSKRWAEANLDPHQFQGFVAGFLNFRLTTNTGAAFSLGEDHGFLMTIFASLITLVIATWSIAREKDKIKPHLVERLGFGCILGGAMGNLLDRFTRGEVTDFIEFSFFDFPIFNVADILINVGLGLVIIFNLFIFKADQHEEKHERETNE